MCVSCVQPHAGVVAAHGRAEVQQFYVEWCRATHLVCTSRCGPSEAMMVLVSRKDAAAATLRCPAMCVELTGSITLPDNRAFVKEAVRA